jgi:hypothetical protein
VIYFIQSGQRPFVKIGYCTGDPRRRLGRLQIGNPEELRLISTKDGGRTEELEWHGRFDHLRVRGECQASQRRSDSTRLRRWLRA